MGLQCSHLSHPVAATGVAAVGSGLRAGSQRLGAFYQRLAVFLRAPPSAVQRCLQPLHCTVHALGEPVACLVRHCVFQRPELAPLDAKLVQRHDGGPQFRAGLGFVSRGHGHAFQRVQQLLARRQVLFAHGALCSLVRGQWFVGGFQRAIETLPKRAAAGAAQAVEFSPARTQVVNEIGMGLELQLGRLASGSGCATGRQRFGLLREVVACTAAGPVLPAAQFGIAVLQPLDARAQCVGRGAGVQQLVNFDQVLVRLGHQAFGEPGLGLRENGSERVAALAARRALVFLRLFTALRALLLAGVFLRALPGLETVFQQAVQTTVGQRRQQFPLLRRLQRGGLGRHRSRDAGWRLGGMAWRCIRRGLTIEFEGGCRCAGRLGRALRLGFGRALGGRRGPLFYCSLDRACRQALSCFFGGRRGRAFRLHGLDGHGRFRRRCGGGSKLKAG